MQALKRHLLRRERDTGQRSREARRHFNALKRKRSLGSVWTYPHLFRLRELLGDPAAPAAGGGGAWWRRAILAPAASKKLSIWSKLQLDTAGRLRYVMGRCFEGETTFSGIVLPYYTPGHVSMLYIHNDPVSGYTCYLFDSNGKEYAQKIITEHRLDRDWNSALGTSMWKQQRRVRPLGMSVGIMQRWQSDTVIREYLKNAPLEQELVKMMVDNVARADPNKPRPEPEYIVSDPQIHEHLNTVLRENVDAEVDVNNKIIDPFNNITTFLHSQLTPFLQRLPREGFTGICAAANYWFFGEWVRSQGQLTVEQLEERVSRGFCDINTLKKFMYSIREYLNGHFESTMTEILQNDIDQPFMEQHKLSSLRVRVCVGTHKFAATVDDQGIVHPDMADSEPCENDKAVLRSSSAPSESALQNTMNTTEQRILEVQNMYHEDGVGSSNSSAAVYPTMKEVVHQAKQAEQYTCYGSIFEIPGPGNFQMQCSTLTERETHEMTQTLNQVLAARSHQPLLDYLIRHDSTHICVPHLYVESDMNTSAF